MPVRRVAREVRTCSRCRLLKLRCDRLKPSCQRCTRANVTCSLGACSPTDEPSTGLLDLATEALPRSDAEASLPSIPGLEHQSHLENKSDVNREQESGVVKQRQRAQLSCIRCHRLKVRCDRDLPCSRCRMSGWGKFCEYRYRVETASPSLDADAPKIGPDLDGRIKSWHAQRRGATHWGGLLSAVSIQVMKLFKKMELTVIAAQVAGWAC